MGMEDLKRDLENYTTLKLKWYWFIPLVGKIFFWIASAKEKKYLSEKKSLIIFFEQKALIKITTSWSWDSLLFELNVVCSLFLLNLTPLYEKKVSRPLVKKMIDEVIGDWPNINLENYDQFTEWYDDLY